MRPRHFHRRWTVASLAFHALVFLTLPDRAVNFIGRANERAGARAAREARSPLRNWTPIQVVEIAEVEEAGEASPAPVEPEVPAERLSPADILERFQGEVGEAMGSARDRDLSPSAGGAEGRFQPPVPLGFRWPDYPEDAGAGGPTRVDVRILVGATGDVLDVEVTGVKSEPLRRAAREWAFGTRWEPARRDGVATDAWFTLAIRFSP